MNAGVQGVHRYNLHGIEGLKSRKSPGAAPSLTAAQKAALKALVVKGPDLAVHKVVRWRCPDRAVGAAIVMPHVNAEAMSLHLAEISARVT